MYEALLVRYFLTVDFKSLYYVKYKNIDWDLFIKL